MGLALSLGGIMLTPEQTLELVLYCKVGVACLAWLTFVVTMRWFQERKRAPAAVLGSDDT
jgi:hypothetical protein